MQFKDEELVTRCLNGDKDAFTFLVERYKTPIFNLICRMIKDREEANDLAQEAFLKAYENLWRYSSSYKFSTWMFQIAKNLTFDYLRKKKPTLVEEDFVENFPDQNSNPEREYLQNETKLELEKAIGTLPSQLKTTVILYHLNGLSYQEMSRVLDIPLHTVKNQLFQARKKLKQLLKEGGRADQ